MKKRLLKVAALFFAACGFVPQAYAQVPEGAEDITATYLKSADMSSYDGWVQTNFNPVSENVAESYAGWNSLEKNSYSLTQDVTLPEGDYCLTAYAFFRQGLTYDTDSSKSLAEMFAGEESTVVKTLGSISLSSYANDIPQASAAFYTDHNYLNQVEFSLSEQKTITIGFRGTFDLKQSWFIAGEVALYKIPLESYKMEFDNLCQELKSYSGLTTGLQGVVEQALEDYADVTNTVAAYREAIAALEGVLEFVETMQMDIEVANGFIVKCEEYVEKSNGEKDAFNQAISTAKSDLDAAATKEAIDNVMDDLETARQAYVLVATPNEGFTFDVTFLVKDAAIAVDGAPAWTNGRTWPYDAYTGAPDVYFLDNNGEIRDIYQDLTDMRPGVYRVSAVTRAEANLAVGYIYLNNTRADVQKQGDTGNTFGHGWGMTTIEEAVVAGNTARIGFYSDCVGKWASVDDFKLEFVRELSGEDVEKAKDVAMERISSLYQPIYDKSTADEEDRNAYHAAIQTAISAIENATTENITIDAAMTALEQARQTYVLVAIPNAGFTFDVTFLMANAAVTSTAGWTNGRTNQNGQYTGAPDNTYLDNYDENRDIFQDLTVRPGVYKLTAATRGQETVDLGYIYLNGTKADIQRVGNQGNNLERGWGWTVTEETAVENGALRIGFYSECTSGRWAGADNFKLEFVRDLDTEIEKKRSEALAEIYSVLDNSTAGSDVQATYRSAIEAVESSIQEAQTVSAIEEALAQALSDLEQARQTYVLEAIPNEGYVFDMTFLIEDAAIAVESSPAWTNVRTWSGGEYNGAPDNRYLDLNNQKSDIYQTVSLRPGVYKLSAVARGHADVTEGYVYINNTRAEIAKLGDHGNTLGHGWSRITTAETPVFGEAKIGFYANSLGTNIYASADDFKLYFVRELTEADKQVTVGLTVTEAGWATLMLPFDADLPDGLNAYTCESTEAGEEKEVANLVLTSAASLEANTPYIIQGAADTYEFKGYSTATQNQYTKGLLTGTYVQMPAVVGSYVLQNPKETGIGFYKVVDVIPTVGAFRVYMNAETADAAGINVSRLILGGDDVTGIESALAGDGDARVDVYSLSGILVRKGVAKNEALNGLQKGIYVVDGVKKAVK